jgi:hypothetical protein
MRLDRSIPARYHGALSPLEFSESLSASSSGGTPSPSLGFAGLGNDERFVGLLLAKYETVLSLRYAPVDEVQQKRPEHFEKGVEPQECQCRMLTSAIFVSGRVPKVSVSFAGR